MPKQIVRTFEHEWLFARDYPSLFVCRFLSGRLVCTVVPQGPHFSAEYCSANMLEVWWHMCWRNLNLLRRFSFPFFLFSFFLNIMIGNAALDLLSCTFDQMEWYHKLFFLSPLLLLLSVKSTFNLFINSIIIVLLKC